MKIYEIGTGYTPIPAQVAAATESVVEQLSKAFISQNIDVEIIDIYSKDRAEHDLPITDVKVPSVFARSDVSLGIVHKLKRVVYSIALASKLKKILKASDEKIILHFHNQYNLFFFVKGVSKRLRSKATIAYTIHNGVWSMPFNEAEGILKKRYFQEIISMKEADLIFALNDMTKQNVETYLGIDRDRVIRIDNGVNTDVYSPFASDKVEEIKEKYNLSGKRVILQVGSVNENKGQARSVKLLETSLKENEDLVFAYVGDIVSQEYFDEIQSLAKELGIEDKVIYLGAVSPGTSMSELYNVASATLFVSNYEGFPLVCIESLASGTPVVLCSKVTLNFGQGSVVCTEDNFKDKVFNNILIDSELTNLSEVSRENAVQNYSWSKIAKDYYNAFGVNQ